MQGKMRKFLEEKDVVIIQNHQMQAKSSIPSQIVKICLEK